MEMMAFVADLCDETEKFAGTATTGLIARMEALRNDLEGDYAGATRSAIEVVRQSGANIVSRATIRAMLDPLLQQCMVAIDYPLPLDSIEARWEALYDYMHANSQTVNDPEDTYDTSYAAGGGNTGNGEVIRLTVDEQNYKLLGWEPDDHVLTCVQDARQLGEKHQEVWKLEATDARPDNLDFTGSGLLVEGITTLSAADSFPYVKNPSFNTTTLDGSNLTSLPGWTQNTGANLYTNLSRNGTYMARTTPGESDNYSLQFDGDETIYQDLVTEAGARFDRNTPYLIDVGIAKVGTPTGTFTLRLSGTIGSGGVSNTLAHTGMTGSGTYDRLRIAVGQNCWPINFNANDLKLQIALASSGSIDASNYFVVDDIVVAPFTRIGSQGDPRTGRGAMGQYIAILGGSTPFVVDDTFSTGSEAEGGTRGVNAYWWFRKAGLGYLPSTTGGTETIADK